MSASGLNKYFLENKYYRVAVAEQGGELQSFFSKQLNAELLWQAGPAWKKHAPVLFPIVGQLKDDTIHHNGKPITLSRHGFARESLFNLVSQTEDELIFSLEDTPESFARYPFHFQFLQKYTLTGKRLQITLEVNNTGKEALYCSYGAHPAFRIPLFDTDAFTDYAIKFDPAMDKLQRWPLMGNLIGNKPEEIQLQNSHLPVSRNLFAADALVFKEAGFNAVSLVHQQHQYGIRMLAEGWPYFGIWSAPGGDFICLEPWQGIADSIHTTGILSEKEGILCVPPGKSHSSSYFLEAVLGIKGE